MNGKPSSEQIAYIKELNKRKRLVLLARLLLFVTFWAMWEIGSRTGFIDAFIFSSPTRMYKSFIQLCKGGILWSHFLTTVIETIVCFATVIIMSLSIAIIMWRIPIIYNILEPYLVLLNSLPKSALAPVLIVWLGNNEKTIIVAAVSVAIFGAIMSIYTALMSVEPEKIKLIKTLGGQTKDILFKLVIPASFPSILSTLKVNLGLCLVGVIIGEFLAARKGLGYLIIYGSQVFKMDWVLLSIIILCALSAFLYYAINLFEKKTKKR